ncbi:MAG TPA: FtsX-like permease family protein [Puia sp.]|nr:FtsX-like permease family protein [Puia sp.]
MLKSYFTIALRNFLRNKLTSIINIGGLMLGLTTGIVICLLLVYAFGFDKFHANYKDIHLVEINLLQTGNVVTYSSTPGPLRAAIQKTIPGLKYVVRTEEAGDALTRYNEKAIYQRSLYAEPDFFHMMTFPSLEGDPVTTLQEGSGVVLTQRAAARLFGNEKALGKTILVNNSYPLKVGAIIRDVPQNSSIEFDLVLPFTLFERNNLSWIDDWNSLSPKTWVQLQPGASIESVDRQMTLLISKKTSLKKVSLFAYPIARLNLYDNFVDGKPYWGKAYLFLVIGFVAFLTVMIACINFMNLSTAMAERRAREVGLRKVLGASRRIIIGQFLGEAVLIAMVALVLSIGLAWLVLPWFAVFAELPLKDQFGIPWVWALLLALGLFTGLVAGSYPALYLSRFQPAKVLRRLMSVGTKGARFRKGLVTFQFVISIFLVAFTIVAVKQMHYVEDRPLGFETSNLVDISANGNLADRFEVFRNAVKDLPGIVDLTASSSNALGVSNDQSGLDWPGKRSDQDLTFGALWVQYDWTKTMRLKIVAGRDFSPQFGVDTSACLLNQFAVRKMGLKEPILGAVVGGKKVIGVIQDIMWGNSLGSPMIVYLRIGNLDHFLIRLTNDRQWKTNLSKIEKVAKALNPGYPFTFQFTDEERQQQFNGSRHLAELMNIFAAMAILISCLGLFGLASFLVERRTKEMSIRKVLGATPARLWFSLSMEMLKPVILSVIIATPLAALALKPLLATYDYHIPLSWWIFAIAGVGAVFIALATVSYHGLRAARINPARSLQTE